MVGRRVCPGAMMYASIGDFIEQLRGNLEVRGEKGVGGGGGIGVCG